MKIISFSLDSKIGELDSLSTKRLLSYEERLERYDVFVPVGAGDGEQELSSRVRIYRVGGNKIRQWWRIGILASKRWLLENYDLLTVQDPYFLGLLGVFLTWRFSRPLEVQIHGFEKLNFFRRLVAKFVLSRASGIRVVSERLKKELVTWGVEPNKINVVPVFTDLRGFSLKQDYRLGDRAVILFVGRLVLVKRIDQLIKALTYQIEDDPDWCLWIVGGGPEEDNLRRLARELEVADKVKWWGWQDDIASFFAQADLFSLVSESEGWGQVLLQAGAAGLPIVATDVGCVGEVLVPGKDLSVLTGNDPEMIAQAWRVLFASEKERREMGQNAHRAVKKMLTEAETIERYLQGWKNIISK